MSAALTAADLPTLDVSGTPGIRSRLVSVELRKLWDTRAGFWLLVSILVVTAGVIVIFFLNTDADQRTFINFMAVTATPQGFLLPVLGILLVTSEWSQRTALTTFTLMPVRGRVLAAKVIASIIAGLVAIVIAMAVAALATVVGGASDGWRNIGADDLGKFALLQVSGVLQGLAFGLLLLSSAAAIVLYFVLPTAFTIVTSLIGALKHVDPWIDLNTAQAPLFDSANLTSTEWAHLGVASLIWIVVPFLLGLVRVLRAEVK